MSRIKVVDQDHARQKSDRRRSGRILLRLPLLVGKPGSFATAEWENVETIMLSRHGGLLRVHQDFSVGAAFEIRRQDKDRTAHARVVWISSRPTPQGIELGFEILDYPEFWEISFPPETPRTPRPRPKR